MNKVKNCFPICFDTYSSKVKYRLDQKARDTKRKDFEDMLNTHYNSVNVTKIDNKDTEILKTKAIIMDNKLKQDYDEKYFYAPLETETEVGDVYLWNETNTHWIVFAHYLTERAYYKTIIKKANWCISWKDKNDVIQYQWVYVRGPVETKTSSITLNRKIYDKPNGTLTILMPNREKHKIFKKYGTIMLNHKKWKISADVDDISNPDLMEIQLVKTEVAAEDDKDKDIVNGLLIPDYNFKPLFNTRVDIGTKIDINKDLILYRNGKVINNDFKIKKISSNAIVSGTEITFPELGFYEFEVIYKPNPEIKKIFKIEGVKFGSTEFFNKILGPTKVKTLFTYKYSTERFKNSDRYVWEVEDKKNIISNFRMNKNEAFIKFGKKTGEIILKLFVNDNLSDSITISSIGVYE